MKVLKVARTSHAGLQVISVDLETGALGRSEQIDQQALESRILSGGRTQQPQLAGRYRLQEDLTGCRVGLPFLVSQNSHIQAFEKGGQST